MENYSQNFIIKNKHLLYLTSLFVIFLFYLLLSIQLPEFDWDSNFYAESQLNLSSNSNKVFFWVYLPTMLSQIFTSIGFFILMDFNLHPLFVINLITAVFGALAVIYFHKTLSLETNIYFSFIGSILLLISNSFIFLIRAGENNVISGFFLIIYLYYCVKIKNDPTSKIDWSLLGIFSSTLLLSHSQNLLFLPLVVILIIYHLLKDSSLIPSILISIVSFVMITLTIVSFFLFLTYIWGQRFIPFADIIPKYLGFDTDYYNSDTGYVLFLRDDFTLRFWLDINYKYFTNNIFGEEIITMLEGVHFTFEKLFVFIWVISVIFFSLIFLLNQKLPNILFYLFVILVISLNSLFVSFYEPWKIERWINLIIIISYINVIITYNLYQLGSDNQSQTHYYRYLINLIIFLILVIPIVTNLISLGLIFL